MPSDAVIKLRSLRFRSYGPHAVVFTAYGAGVKSVNASELRRPVEREYRQT
jgi:hypothetical protein